MIYVVSPIFRTGGVELLHQVGYELSKYADVRMAYVDKLPLIEEYAAYQIPYIWYQDMPDDDSFVILPEIFAKWDIGGHRRVVCWESVDNYFLYNKGTDFDPDTIHISQTEYSYRFLTEQVKAERIIRATDYINQAFLEPFDEQPRRRNVVLYNPAKGMEYTERIMAACKDLEFIPLAGMSRLEVRKQMRTAKLFIDFGNHPGKDRMPREAIASGCCVITSRRGSAAYYQDVPLFDEYKFDGNDIHGITVKIYDIMNDYDHHRNYFEIYRQMVRGEKELFEHGMRVLADVLMMNGKDMRKVIDEVLNNNTGT